MNFLKNIKISTKVFGGFGLVLTLLLVIGVSGIVALGGVGSGFGEYRSTALQTNQAGRVQANLLETRLAVRNFMIDGSEKSIADVQERSNATLALIDEYMGLTDDAEKTERLAASKNDIATYIATFEEVTRLQATRNGLVNDRLNVDGPKMEANLTKIMTSAFNDGDAQAAYYAGIAMRSVMLMRLYATRFLITNDAESYARVGKELADAERQSTLLLQELRNPARRAAATEFEELLKDYSAAFEQVAATISKRNDLTVGVLDTIGPRVAGQMEELKLAIKAEQDTLGPQMASTITNTEMFTGVLAVISVIFGVAAAWLIGMGISRPIAKITTAMRELAEGDKSIEIPGKDHKDEIGDMAAAVEVFKENMIKAEALAAKEAEESRLREERARRLMELTNDFDHDVSELLVAVSSGSTQMTTTASSMSKIAEDTNGRASTVASAAEQASVNVQTVASATEELSTSIEEISKQITLASEIAVEAVTQADKTDSQIQSLSEAAEKIGEVVELITDIAEQTNLLALNATIEAARAGEAGKGFSVVASEVKNLAQQTAKATEAISRLVTSIQSETTGAVDAIQVIRGTIDRINQTAATVASAVEEQGAATREIAKSVEEAARGTQQVSSNIVEVSRAASETGTAATQVANVAGELNGKADNLKSEVERFLTDVKAA